MIKNYLKAILRNLIKNKAFSAINIGGLAIGISSCVLIFMYVSFEFNYDKYHSEYENIYRIAQIGKSGEIENIDPKTVPPLAHFLKENFPEVEYTARFQQRWPEIIETDVNSFWTDKIFAVDNEIFNIFNINFIEGDKKTALTQPYSTVITRSTAEKFFGQKSAVGKTIKKSNTDYEITGVVENPPDNTHWKYNVLITNVMPADQQFLAEKSWIFNIYYTYIKLLPNTDINSFEIKINTLVKNYAKEKWEKRGYSYSYFLQAINEIHLNPLPINEIEPAADSKVLYIFSIIAILILTIACINYINL
ncbi:ABC transporter permease, partial [Bacteroidota bacterium]